MSNHTLSPQRRRALWAAVPMALAALGPLSGAASAQGIADPIPQPITAGDIRVELELVAEGFGSPVVFKPVPGRPGDFFIADQAGKLWLVREGGRAPRPVLDISDRLVRLQPGFDERGLLGLAFHPGFADPDHPGHGKLYTYSSEKVAGAADFTVKIEAAPGITIPPNNQSVVAEWRISDGDPDLVDPASRREIMRIDQPQFNHDGGELVFGPDGFLYIGFGDGGAANDLAPGHSPGGNGQDTTNILGTIIRIDPLGRSGSQSANGQYSIPQDNPFVGDDGALDEIWAYGLRNPWRFSFDRETGELIAADVGQENLEEIDIIRRGGNYGWPIKEGTFYFLQEAGRGENITRTPPGNSHGELIDPAAQYDHGEGISITGGFVYRGGAIPQLRGLYVFGDWKRHGDADRGRLMYADLRTGEIRDLPIGRDGRQAPAFITAFGQDEEGELYMMTNTSGGPTDGDGGRVWKIIPVE